MRRTAILVLVVVVAGQAVTAGWRRDGRDRARAADDDRRAVMRAAAAHAINLLSVNHRSIDRDMKRVLTTSTGPEREAHERDARARRESALRNKVVQTGVLRAIGLESMSADRHTADVLVVADAVIRWENGENATPEERFYRWRMRVGKVGGLWLVSESELVP
jgi:Mce-associated membrane protein